MKMPLPSGFLLLGTLALCILSFPGCAPKKVDPHRAASAAADTALGEDYKTTKRDQVPMFRAGPQQLTAADRLLEKGALVRVMRTTFGYSFVQIGSGELGWVPSEDLTTAEAPRVAASVPLPPPNRSSVSNTDVMNATAVGTSTEAMPGPNAEAVPGAKGDSAIVGHFTLDPGKQPSPSPSPTP
ncbi:MAG TPA: hypothetical protein VGD78_23325 [Chthoniobacterales bacterium]